MNIFFIILFFSFGLIIGSFLNVVICRLNTKKSLGGRSICMSCCHQLSVYELVPFFSFCFLKGRCKNCKTKISFIYPLVELITGIVFLILFLKFQNLLIFDKFLFIFNYIYYAIIFSLLITISFYDLRHKIIPDILSIILGIFSFIGLFFLPNFNFHIPSLLEFLVGPLLALPFFLIWLFSSGNWMGFGDVKLTVNLGYLLGLSKGLFSLALACWLGAIIGVFLLIFSKKYNMKSEIPFAIYLALGVFFTFIFNLYFF